MTYWTMTLNAFHQSVQRNGSLWAHMYLTRDNADPDPSSPTYREDSVHHVKKRAFLALACAAFSFTQI